jgi:hypothetical protein
VEKRILPRLTTWHKRTMVKKSSCLPYHITKDKRAIFKAMQWLNYCSVKKTLPIINWTHTATLNESAQEQWKPEISAVFCQPTVPRCWRSTEQVLLQLCCVNAINSSLQSRDSTTLAEQTIAAERTAVPGLAAAATWPGNRDTRWLLLLAQSNRA